MLDMKECIIVAGGVGNRLKDIVADAPKCMAVIAGKPFLSYLFNYLIEEKFEHVILSLGYKSDIVLDWIKTVKLPFKISYLVENKALGTGGAIKLAIGKTETETPFVINGDTLFRIDTSLLMEQHLKKQAEITVALKPMKDFNRYGVVEVDTKQRVVDFKEKHKTKAGLINGGVYVINKTILKDIQKEVFSFEKKILENTDFYKIYGYEDDSYFIDIGTPNDYNRANLDFFDL